MPLTVPRFAIHENNWFTTTPLENLFDEQQGIEVKSAGRHFDVDNSERLHIDCSPDVELGLFDFQLGLIDSDGRIVFRM